MPKTIKILSYNLGYCSGFTGSLPQYVLYGHRHVKPSAKVKGKVFDALQTLMKTEQPDLCCFQEIDDHALRELETRLGTDYVHFHGQNKYGEASILRRIPHFSRKGNGFVAKNTSTFTTHYFKTGVKKLFFEIDVAPDLAVFAGHFALGKQARQKQFEELKHLLQEKKRVILCGDFNIFKGFGELQDLIHHYDLRILNTDTDHTFPAHRPKRSLDLFICSKDIDVQSFKVLAEPKVSDHLPVIMEVRV